MNIQALFEPRRGSRAPYSRFGLGYELTGPGPITVLPFVIDMSKQLFSAGDETLNLRFA